MRTVLERVHENSNSFVNFGIDQETEEIMLAEKA